MSQLRTISVTGLGYVGLPLAVAFARHTKVIAFDTNQELIAELRLGMSEHYRGNPAPLNQTSIIWTTNADDLRKASFHIIAVPTPITNSRIPDLKIILSVTENLAKYIKKGDVIVYESTVYPGLTEEECIPILESVSGMESGRDFFVGYSPERINPGDTEHTLENTIKIISAQDDETLGLLNLHYSQVVKSGLHPVSSIKVAEAAKIIENTQRDINIALMNELAVIFNLADIDTREVLDAANTKWNFLPFTPGLVGGHCVGIDPYYLTYKATQLGYSPRVILSGRSVNDSMGKYVARVLVKQLIRSGKVIKGSRVTILGLTFKENISDIRNSRVIDIIYELHSYDIEVQVHDPYVNPLLANNEFNITMLEEDKLKPATAVILAVTHKEFLQSGWAFISGLLEDKKGVVFDVKSALPMHEIPSGIILQRL